MTGFQADNCSQFADLLGVYALDALDPDEAELVGHHLRTCPRCAQEVDQHRETVVLLAGGGGSAPDEVWDRISSAISGDMERSAARPAPRLVSVGASRRPRWRRPVLATALAAAAAIAAVVGVQTARVDQLNHRVNQLSAAARQTGGFQGLAAALVDPTARHYSLTSTSAGGRPVGQLVILTSGASYLVGSRLPQVASDRTYQLWSMVDGRAISVGLLGDHPGTVAFTVDPTVPISAYLVTVEPAGGVVTPTGPPVAQATV